MRWFLLGFIIILNVFVLVFNIYAITTMIEMGGILNTIIILPMLLGIQLFGLFGIYVWKVS